MGSSGITRVIAKTSTRTTRKTGKSDTRCCGDGSLETNVSRRTAGHREVLRRDAVAERLRLRRLLAQVRQRLLPGVDVAVHREVAFDVEPVVLHGLREAVAPPDH